ncbi:MAG: hypothetical protein ABJA34_08855, partial [Pseudonocardiales bacterium]
STALTSTTSSTFTITAAAGTTLVFGQQPTGTVAGASISPSPTVRIFDQFGNLTASTASVTVAIGTNPAGGTLSGTATAAAVNGTATFPGLSINKAGTGYTLTAASTGLTGTASSAFTITAATASQLGFTSAPFSGPQAATANLGPVTVQLQDQFGNAILAAGSITVALSKSGGGNGNAVFSSTLNGATVTSVTIAAGTSSVSFYFGYSKATSALTLNAAASGLTSAGQMQGTIT